MENKTESLKVGDVVAYNTTKELGRITRINPNGTYAVLPNAWANEGRSTNIILTPSDLSFFLGNW